MSSGNGAERVKGKVEEVGGAIQASVGRIVGNEDLEADGKAKHQGGVARQESAKAGERIKGAIEEFTGGVKNDIGRLIDNKQMKVEGAAKKLKGQARQKANR